MVNDDESAIVCLAIPNENATRVCAGVHATLASSKVLYLKYVPGHFTALLPRDADASTEKLLKALPSAQGSSFIGSHCLQNE